VNRGVGVEVRDIRGSIAEMRRGSQSVCCEYVYNFLVMVKKIEYWYTAKEK
jgi:hypothetical protein